MAYTYLFHTVNSKFRPKIRRYQVRNEKKRPLRRRESLEIRKVDNAFDYSLRSWLRQFAKQRREMTKLDSMF